MFKYMLLGIIQGLTEFFPVSSSAHLVIAQKILGIRRDSLELTVVLHLGTILALVIFFFKDIIKALGNLRLAALIIVATVITGIIGVSGKVFFERLFSEISLVALALIITGTILILTRKFIDGKRNTLGIKDALILGFAQAIAIIPGISRSGITISTLLFRRIDRKTAFRFSFIASIPAVFGAGILEAKNIEFSLKVNFLNFAIGFVFSFIFGVFSLGVLKMIVDKARLHYFGYYCILVAIITLLFIK